VNANCVEAAPAQSPPTPSPGNRGRPGWGRCTHCTTTVNPRRRNYQQSEPCSSPPSSPSPTVAGEGSDLRKLPSEFQCFINLKSQFVTSSWSDAHRLLNMLSIDEFSGLRSQIVTSSSERMFRLCMESHAQNRLTSCAANPKLS
jgi:hypothetical protein